MEKHISTRWVAVLAAALCLLLAALMVWPRPKDDRPVIRVGYYNYQPYISNSVGGGAQGIDAELAEEAFGRMGYRVEFVRIDWDQKDVLLAQHAIDCAWAGFVMTGRESEYRWAGPYLESRHVVVVPADSDIRFLTNLAGRSIAVTSGSRTETALLHKENPSVPSTAGFYCFDSLQETRAALCSGYYDAAAGNELAWRTLLEDRESEFRILEEPLAVTQLGVAFDKDADPELVARLTAVLDEMKADGTLADIVENGRNDTPIAGETEYQ